MPLRYIFILLTFSATVAQGLWVNWLQDEAILVVDIPLVMLYIFGFTRKRLSQAPYALPALILTGVFFVWSHLGLFFAPNQLYFRQEMVMNIRALLIFIAIILFVNSKEDLQFIFLGFAGGILFQGLVAVHQWLIGPVGLGFLGEQRRTWQAQGTFVHASVLGMYLSLLCILTYRMAVFLRPKYHPLYVVGFLVGVLGLYASFNRATWLGFAAAMALMFVVDLFQGFLRSKRARTMLFLMVLVGAAGVARYGNTIVERFSDSEESLMADRSSSRKSLALDAIRIMNAHATVGTGLNNYRMYVDEKTAGLQIVHCSYLLIGAELGYPGLVIFSALLVSFLLVGAKGMRSKDVFVKNVSAALVGAMTCFAIAILPSPDYRNLYVKNHIWMIFGLTLVAAKLDYFVKKKTSRQSKSSRPKASTTNAGRGTVAPGSAQGTNGGPMPKRVDTNVQAEQFHRNIEIRH